jgi:hypothetical protein
VALPLLLDHPLVHGHAGVSYHAEHMAKFKGRSMLCFNSKNCEIQMHEKKRSATCELKRCSYI